MRTDISEFKIRADRHTTAGHLLIVSAFLALLGFLMSQATQVASLSDMFVILLFATGIIYFFWCVVALVRPKVLIRADHHGLRVYGRVGHREIKWDQLEKIDIGHTGGQGRAQYYFILFYLKDGHEEEVTNLSSQSLVHETYDYLKSRPEAAEALARGKGQNIL